MSFPTDLEGSAVAEKENLSVCKHDWDLEGQLVIRRPLSESKINQSVQWKHHSVPRDGESSDHTRAIA